MEHLALLRRSGLIEAGVLDTIELEAAQGGSLINHLHKVLGERLPTVWEQLAASTSRDFIVQPTDAGPIDARLLSLNQALDYLVLPRVVRYRTVHVLSPDPFLRLGDLDPLRASLKPFTFGAPPIIRIDLTTPSAFRELFSLIFPNANELYQSAADVLSLAALIPRNAGTSIRATPEERADAHATVLGLPFIDPDLLPPIASAIGDHPAGPFIAAQLYPHSRDEVGHLTVLGALGRDSEIAQVQSAAQHLASALGDQLDLALTSGRRLAGLFKTQPLN